LRAYPKDQSDMDIRSIVFFVPLILLFSISTATRVGEIDFCEKFTCSSLGTFADFSFPRNPPKTLNPSLLLELYSRADHHFSGLFKCGSGIFSLDCLKEKYPNHLVTMDNVLVQNNGRIRSVHSNELYLDDNILNLRTWKMAHHEVIEPYTILQKALMIEGRFTENYYHFLTETFPRVLMAREVLDLTEMPIIISNTEIVRNFLGLLGIHPSQIISPSAQGHIFVQELYYPSSIPMDLPSKDRLHAIRSFMEEQFPIQEPEQNQDLIIYISREKYIRSTPKLDEEQLLASLEKAFPSYSLEIFSGKESLEETVRMFRRAKIILGAHGAGLTNMIFSQPNTIIGEVTQTSNPLFLFWHISQAMDHEYWLIPAAGQSSWKDDKFYFPIPEILNSFSVALGIPIPDTQCSAGNAGTILGCYKCPMGFVSRPGSNHCKICPANTYADDRQLRCLKCPPHTRTLVISKDFSLLGNGASPISALGSSTRRHCLTSRDVDFMLTQQDPSDDYC